MTLDPLAQIAVIEKAINEIEKIPCIDTEHTGRLSYVKGLLEGMKEMLEYSAGKCKPEDQF